MPLSRARQHQTPLQHQSRLTLLRVLLGSDECLPSENCSYFRLDRNQTEKAQEAVGSVGSWLGVLWLCHGNALLPFPKFALHVVLPEAPDVGQLGHLCCCQCW